ncbi:acetyltransferase (GNAT) family protein [Gemmobacter caeni]|uniref:Acetyltransferase (GNAT) family protein n=1 Tax=Gemmobacter caeni TaxID=589035 RepID=A0A2T6B8B2_9RHOB|nr:GNAT family N-acetyltransferase [Gemmobacter caeni]PTX52296.1 acetyltransferase (GNAT) family protein [Gemmobacter caeni]TWJ02669.1 acetyltransferase (GNAT) family protein [Gemmobacter caeni]
MTPASALLSAVEARWGAPGPSGRTPLLIDGVRVGEIALGAGLPDTVRIATIFVEERYRGHGVGTRLLRELGDLADAAGCALTLEAFVRPDRADGGLPGLYARLGFVAEHGPCEQGYLEMVRRPLPAPDPDDYAEPDHRRIVADLIAGMAVFAASLPLTAALRPYRNAYAPELAYPALVLTDLFADRPGQGAGSAYLAELSRRCDAAGLTLYTDAQDERSRDFYLARGFERTTGRRDHQLARWAPEPNEEDPSP